MAVQSTAAPARLGREQVRGIWFERQLLGDGKKRSPADAATEAGWLRTFGGNVYISLRARCAGLSRTTADGAVFSKSELVNVPSVHSCVMLVPFDEAALSLQAALPGVEKEAQRVAEKCGFKLQEIDELGRTVVKALKKGPLAPDELRKTLPEGSVRSLGEAGKKIGESSTLTVCLKLLSARGDIQRLPEGDRLDVNRLRYGVFGKKIPLASAGPIGDEQLAVELVTRHLRWAAPAALEEIAGWTDVGKKRCAAALQELGAVPVEVDGHPQAHFALPDDPWISGRRRLTGQRRWAFLPPDDNLLGLRGSLARLLPDDLAGVRFDGKKLAEHRSLNFHVIVDRGAVIGVWEWDPRDQAVTWAPFTKVAKSDEKELAAEAADLGAFIGDQLGDLKMISIDSDAARGKRLDVIRAL